MSMGGIRHWLATDQQVSTELCKHFATILGPDCPWWFINPAVDDTVCFVPVDMEPIRISLYSLKKAIAAHVKRKDIEAWQQYCIQARMLQVTPIPTLHAWVSDCARITPDCMNHLSEVYHSMCLAQGDEQEELSHKFESLRTFYITNPNIFPSRCTLDLMQTT